MAHIAFIVADDFEDKEFETPHTTVLEHGHTTAVIGIEADTELTGRKGAVITTDTAIADADADDYDALVIPGGYSPDHLRTNDDMVAFTKAMADRNVPLAVICHAPWMLIEAGLAADRRIASWPSLRTDLENAGATWVDEATVLDGNLITARNPDDLPPFTQALLEALHDPDADLGASNGDR